MTDSTAFFVGFQSGFMNRWLFDPKAMDQGVLPNGVCRTETGRGEEDVYSCRRSDASSADHLVVMVHGILGSDFHPNFRLYAG
ncbi:hypothetical protein M569_04323 [Genlisea aurea]|uniref:DUF676 domain-containing protein n=1 Tax=Genlisea aurea TaxID=192259 RepID=S8ED42_9LAMI|nr:hypothetical protein M569_04323 [Genlisea aurea]